MVSGQTLLTLASKLVNELVEAADDKQLTKLINRYGRVDLILVDELEYLQLDRREPSCCSKFHQRKNVRPCLRL